MCFYLYQITFDIHFIMFIMLTNNFPKEGHLIPLLFLILIII